MKFNLRRPCANCPFRTDIRPFLSGGGARQYARALYEENTTFSCHKTIEYGTPRVDRTGDQSHCAGALIMMRKDGRPNAMLQIAERLGLYEPDKLDMGAPVFDTFDEFVQANEE